MTATITELHPVDPSAVLLEADDIAALEATLKARKDANKKQLKKALAVRRAELTTALHLKPLSNDWHETIKKNQRNYILDQMAQAIAAGRLTITSDKDDA